MKNKILAPIAVAIFIILVIAGFKSFNSAPVTLSNTLPMYGASSFKQYISKRSPEMKATDEAFILEVTASTTKEEAIKKIINLGWSNISRNDLDAGMENFNQVWLLDQDNFNVQWGYGAVLGIKGELQKSADYFDKAIEMYSEVKAVTEKDYLPLWNDSALSFVNLSESYLKTNEKTAKKYASKAIKLLEDSLEQRAGLSKRTVMQEAFLLSVAYFNLGDYKTAWGIYNQAVTEFPEIKADSDGAAFEKMLAEKGV